MAVVINGNGNITGLDGVFSADSVNTLVDTRIDSDSFVEHNEFNTLLDARIDSADFVTLTGNQTVAGVKTFSDSAQFNSKVRISAPEGGNGSGGISESALHLTSSNQTTLSVMNDSDGFANLNLGSIDPLGDGSNKSNFWHISYRNLSTHSNKLEHWWYDSSGFAGPRTTLTTDGNFGISTSSPDAKLHVAGSFRQTAATVPFEWTVNAGANDYYKLNAVGYADNLIVANAAGRVGIGTSNPGAKLHVEGTIKIGTTGHTYSAGTIGYTDGNYGFIYRPPQAGGAGAHLFEAYDGTDLVKITESGEVNLSAGGAITGASNLQRTDETGAAAGYGKWIYPGSAYAYDATNGIRYIWWKIGQFSSSTTSRITIEYEAKDDVNYPGFVKGIVAIGHWGENSFSVQHDLLTAQGSIYPKVRVDESHNVWIQMDNCTWNHHWRYRIHIASGTFTPLTSWTDGTDRLDSASHTTPPANSSENIDAGENVRIAWSGSSPNTFNAQTIPTYNFFRELGMYRAAYQPAFSAYKNANQSPYNTNATVVFDAEYWDTGADFNTSTGVFTAPASGKYLLIANCLIGSASAGNHFEMILSTSNRGYYAGMPGRIEYQAGTSWGDGYISLGIAQIVDMDVNDTAYVYFPTFGGGYIYGSGWSKFSGYLLG